MNKIVRRPILALVFIPLILLFALASACGDVISFENKSTATPLPPAATATVSPTVTYVPLATATSIPNAPLSVVPIGTVELSVLVEPLDVGYVEVVGSIRLSNGDATEVHKNDQINVIARPVDSKLWRFERWEGDIQGPFAADSLVMDSSKKIRAIFVRVDTRTQVPAEFYGVMVNGQPVQNLIIGGDNGSIEVSPAPGPGANPFREYTIVSLTPRPNEGYEPGAWGLDCGGSGSCILTMNDHKEVTISFKIIQHSLAVAAQPASGGNVDPTGTTEHDYGDWVSVTAQPSSGFLFGGYSGDCSGTGSCSVLMDQQRSVTANFNKVPTPTPVPSTPILTPVPTQTLTTSASFGGTINPFGFSSYAKGSVIEISQAPNSGYTFNGWGGNCSGTGSCLVTMDSDKNVTANFILKSVPTPIPTLTPTLVPPTPTPTPVPPTPTPTPVPPTPTPTPVPPTPTPTPVPPTPTPTPQPPAGKIAFHSNRDGNNGIYIMNSDGTSQSRLITNSAAATSPKWSPNGDKIAFSSNGDIYVMDADGSSVTRLTDNPSTYEGEPDWSPDGTKITFGSLRSGSSDIYIMDADGSNQTRLTSNPDFEVEPAWSPDGTVIAFTSYMAGGNSGIYVMEANGFNRTRLTSQSAHDYRPTWSPDGTSIAFTSYRDGNWEIYRMNADGSNQTRLTATTGYNNILPAWSPDGTKIAFTSDRDGNQEIYVMNSNGLNQTNITNNPGRDEAPNWSP